MATLTITVAGSAIVNGGKTYTLSDTDLQSLLDMAAARFFGVKDAPTNQQVLSAWVQDWIDTTKILVRQAKTVTTTPPPITIS